MQIFSDFCGMYLHFFIFGFFLLKFQLIFQFLLHSPHRLFAAPPFVPHPVQGLPPGMAITPPAPRRIQSALQELQKYGAFTTDQAGRRSHTRSEREGQAGPLGCGKWECGDMGDAVGWFCPGPNSKLNELPVRGVCVSVRACVCERFMAYKKRSLLPLRLDPQPLKPLFSSTLHPHVGDTFPPSAVRWTRHRLRGGHSHRAACAQRILPPLPWNRPAGFVGSLPVGTIVTNPSFIGHGGGKVNHMNLQFI